MKGQTTTITNDAREDCCDGLEPAGLTCTCGRHFHIGTVLLADDDRLIECPSCEGGCTVADLSGEVKESSHLVAIRIACEGASVAVAERIREIAMTRTTSDPQFWINVRMREDWKEDHGSYDKWDEAATAAGQTPSLYGPAT